MVTDTASRTAFPAVRDTTIRPLAPGESLEVRRVARASILLGRPISLEYADLVSYERLCIDWHLTEGRRHVRVLEQDGEIIGCLLACLDQPAYEAWFRRRVLSWTAGTLQRLATGQLGSDARRFVAHRIRDGLAARWPGAGPPFPAHARLYTGREVEGVDVRGRLATTMDEMVQAAGLAGWCSHVNLPEGQSTGTLERAGYRIVDRMPSRTGSWLLGTPVDRVTLARVPTGGRPGDDWRS